MTPTTRRLAMAFFVLLVLTVAWNSLERRRTTSREHAFERVKTEDIQRIDLSGKGKEITLELSGGRWMITSPIEYPADQTQVENLLEKVDELTVVNLVSSNPANHDLYEVGVDTGVLVQLFGGREGDRRLLAFYVGKMTSDFSHTYIRRFTEDDVYTAGGLISGYFDKALGNWRDKTIFSVPTGQVEQVTVESEEINWTLSSRGTVPGAPDAPWVMQVDGDMVVADSSQSASIVRKFASLSASGFPDLDEEVTIDPDSLVVRAEARLKDGTALEFSAYRKPGDTSRYYITKAGDETVFLMYRSNLDSILRTREDLEAKEEEPPGL